MDAKPFPWDSPQEKEGGRSTLSILSVILDQLPDGLMVLDLENKVRLANRAATRILDINWLGKGEIAGPDLVEDAFWKEALTQPMESLPFTFEAALATSNIFLVEVSYLPGLGKLVKLQDVSRYKLLEKVKDEFVHAVSHDLRSPLTAVLGYIGLIERVGPITEQQQEFIRQALTGVETIRHMLDKLLELQRVEAGLDAQTENIQAQLLLEQTADAFNFQVTRRGQTLALDLPEESLMLHGNPIRLRQVFDNLVDNASKYTPAGGEIRLSARMENDLVIVQVRDNGPGIPDNDLPHIFDQFYRGSNILDQTPGAGLGLSIVRSVVESYQGRIWVESTAERGSTFTVVLPSAQAAQ